jgi:hypothetical protein
MSLLQAGFGSSGGEYTIDDSLRFRSSASAYLSRTPASAGDRKKWTWSGWVKSYFPGAADQYSVFNSGLNTSTHNGTYITFTNDGIFRIVNQTGSALSFDASHVASTAVYRDPSAWYHLVIAWDTAQGTAANRVKLYVNGVQVTALSQTDYPTQDLDSGLNNDVAHSIGSILQDGSRINYYDGYMTEFNFIDGQALDPTDFGEYDDNGTWKPLAYTGTYGTNGFYLNGVGVTDQSGNGNDWTNNNLNLSTSTATTYDQMKDTPSLVDTNTGNFATLNPIEPSSGVSVTLSEGNLKAVGTTSSYSGAIASTFEQSSGKWYWEVYVNSEVTAGSNFYNFVGAATGDNNLIHKSNNSQVPSVAAGVNGWSWEGDGTINLIGTGTTAVGSVTAPTAGDVLGFAIDLDNGNVYFYHNGTAQNSGSPVITGVTGLLHNPMVGVYNGSTVTFNFGQRPFAYTPPSGFLKLNTFNLPDSTIEKGSDYFNTVLYTGTGAIQSITGINFQPDLVWAKSRSEAVNHRLFDSVRGATNRLNPNASAVEGAESGVTSFDSDGFTLGSDGGINTSSATYVAWNWLASNTTASNTVGSITSTVSVNTTSGFSIVSYTGTLVHRYGRSWSWSNTKIYNYKNKINSKRMELLPRICWCRISYFSLVLPLLRLV